MRGETRWQVMSDGMLMGSLSGIESAGLRKSLMGSFGRRRERSSCPFASVLLDMIWHDIPQGTKAPVGLVVLWRCLAVLEESAGNDGGEPSSGDETGHCGVKKGQEKAGVWGCGWLSRLQPFFSSCSSLLIVREIFGFDGPADGGSEVDRKRMISTDRSSRASTPATQHSPSIS